MFHGGSLCEGRSGAEFFLFSGRRRHTRLGCDWSSDVCSSDLLSRSHRRYHRALGHAGLSENARAHRERAARKIGRASRRERGEISVVGVSLKKKSGGNTSPVARSASRTPRRGKPNPTWHCRKV